jgi:hypothetical protein
MQKSKKADFSLQGEIKTDMEWESAISKEVSCFFKGTICQE